MQKSFCARIFFQELRGCASMMIGDFPMNLYSLDEFRENNVADFGNVLLRRRGIAKKGNAMSQE